MLKSERAKFIQQRLNELYPNPPIPLEHQSSFQLLVAVLLSAQCTDKRVNEVTPNLFAIASDAHAMLKVPTEQIYKIIRPCGLAPKKSAAISELSRILVEKYDGEVPENLLELEMLPGVGHKTASVVMSQGFGHPAFPVDTHIHRLAQRWGLTKGKNVTQTEKDLKRLFPPKPGINYIFKLFFMEENIVLPEVVTAGFVTSARLAIPTEKSHSKIIKHNN